MPTSVRRLYLLRHAKAAAARPGERDRQRQLDEIGRQEAMLIGQEMRANGWIPDIVVTSSATRCRQTSELVVESFGRPPAVDAVDNLYDGTLQAYLDVITGRAEASLLLVGHNPVVEELFEHLAGETEMRRYLAEGYPTAGLAVFDRQDVPGRHGDWRVAAMTAP